MTKRCSFDKMFKITRADNDFEKDTTTGPLFKQKFVQREIARLVAVFVLIHNRPYRTKNLSIEKYFPRKRLKFPFGYEFI